MQFEYETREISMLKGPRVRPAYIHAVYIEMDITEVGFQGVVWIRLAQQVRVADSRENGNETLSFIKCGECLD